MNDVISSCKNIVLTLLICCVLYPGIVWIIAKSIAPAKAEGSLIKNSSCIIIGSHLIGQQFTSPGYFWSRPSAVDYNASGSGGSNLATTNPALRERIKKSLANLDQTNEKQVPLDMVTNSGSGLDPDITIEGALYQAERVAKTRGVDVKSVIKLVLLTTKRNVFNESSIVNVLKLNQLLDKEIPYDKQSIVF